MPSRFAEYQPRDPKTVRHPRADVVISPATPGDASQIAAIIAEREEIGLDEACERARRIVALPTETHCICVARVDSAFAGFARAAYVPQPTDPAYAHVPEGWYLVGVMVAPEFRRRGIGLALTRHRLSELAARGAAKVWYFANSVNRATIDLHAQLGFEEVMRDFRFPGATFSAGGTGILYRACLIDAGQLNNNSHSV